MNVPKETIAKPQVHYGSPKAATRHFITQRLTGAINVLFLIFLAWLVVRLAGADRAEMVSVVGHPLVAVLLVLLLVIVPVHMRIGMREVIEDYVHDERLHQLSLMLNTLFAVFVGLVGIVAVLKIAFWG